MPARLFILLAAAFGMAGCVPSLHSIVTEKTLVYDPALAGVYRVDKSAWTISGDPNEKSYSIVIEESDEKQSVLTAQLVEFQAKRYLDFYPSDEAELNAGDWFKAHLLGVHVFWRLDTTDSGFALSGLNPDAVKDLLKDKPQMIKHEVVEDGRVVLTDTSENLQAFLAAGLKIEKFYGDPIELKPLKN